MAQHTMPRSVLNVDGLSLILSIIVLKTDEVGVGRCTENCAKSHDMVITIV